MAAVHHVSLPVPTHLVDDECRFLVAALKPLGYSECFRVMPTVVALGTEHNPFLWVSNMGAGRVPIPEGEKVQCVHLALRAKNRQEVDDFHAAAVINGGTCNGPPGIRKEYHESYYAAFVYSPAGHNIEVVITTCAED
ncbi:hypothetical protein JCM24511_07897 [Saitozyma sp. JCM 24511]|nr:hypothetical protein JCM24511_07897 [Saitozyma sp. JCM 24511]